MGYMVSRDDGWRMPGWLWERVEPLLPAPPFHPLGCHAPRVADRDAMDAILLVLRTGIQWNALSATGVCSSSSAHRRFQEWEQAGVFHEIWREGLLDYDANGRYRLVVPLGRWRDDEGAVGWPEDWAQIPRIGRKGGEAFGSQRGSGGPDRAGARRRQPQRPAAARADAEQHPDRAPHADERAPAGAVPGSRL